MLRGCGGLVPCHMLEQLSERVHALLGGVNCAIVDLGNSQALLVDSGQDKDHGRKIRKALDQLGLKPSVILCTHSHADHYGGNAYLLRQFPGAQVWAPEIEADIIRSPILEPIYLFHGAKPLPELTSKWLQAEASPVHRVVSEGQEELNGVPLSLIDVRGHAHRQLAVLVDDVLLATDSLFGGATLEKYPFPFSQDVGGQLASIDKLVDLVGTGAVRVALPGHGEPTEQVGELAELNRRALQGAAAVILSHCEDVGTEEVLARATTEMGAIMTDLARYHLNFTTITAYLGWLRQEGRITGALEDGKLVWRNA